MKSISLRSLLLFGIAAIQIVGAVVFLVTFFTYANRAANDHARENLDWALTSVRQEVVNFFSNAELAVNSAIRLSQSPLLDTGDPAQLQRYFFETLEGDPQLTGAFHATGRGDFVFVTRESAALESGEYFARTIAVAPDRRTHQDVILRTEAPPRIAPMSDISGFLPRQRPWFTGAMQQDGFAWTDPYIFFVSGQPGITIARRVPGTEDSDAEIFGIDLSLVGISRFIDSLSLSPGGQVFVAHPSGQMIAFPGYPETAETGKAAIPHFSDHHDPAIQAAFSQSGTVGDALTEASTAEFTFEADGQTYFAVFQPLNMGSVTWRIGAIAPSRDFIGWFDDVRMAALALILLLTALSMLAGWILWHRIEGNLKAIRVRSHDFLFHDKSAFESKPTSGIRELAETETALANMAAEIDKRARQNHLITERLAAIVAAVDHAPVAIAIFDPAGDVAYMNPLIEAFLELSQSDDGDAMPRASIEMIAAVDRILKPPHSGNLAEGTPENSHPADGYLSEAVAAGTAWEGHLSPVVAAGEESHSGLYAIAAPMQVAPGITRGLPSHALWFLVIEDATKRQAAEHALVAAVERAEDASSAKSRFLAGMSHELRTPLNSILGYSEILLHEKLRPEQQERQREYAESIHESGRILLGILTNILDMTAIETGRLSLNLSDVQLSHMAARAAHYEAPRCEKAQIKVQISIPDDLHIRADAFKLERVIANLLQNCAKYAGAGSTVTIEAKPASNGSTEITVEDDGVGIQTSEMDAVMEPFRRLNGDVNISMSEGVGLGLPLADSIVRLHRGTLTLSEGSNGKGLRVSITLPNDPDRGGVKAGR